MSLMESFSNRHFFRFIPRNGRKLVVVSAVPKKSFCLKNMHLCCFLLAHSINESNQRCPAFLGSHNPTICEIINYQFSPCSFMMKPSPNETNKSFTSVSNITDAEMPDSSCHVPRRHVVPILRHVAVGPW